MRQETKPRNLFNVYALCGRLNDDSTKNDSMKKVFYFTLLGLSILGILLVSFGIINTGLSLKYETDNPARCISLVTGRDLCLTIKIMYGLVVICVLTIATLLVFRKRILR